MCCHRTNIVDTHASPLALRARLAQTLISVLSGVERTGPPDDSGGPARVAQTGQVTGGGREADRSTNRRISRRIGGDKPAGVCKTAGSSYVGYALAGREQNLVGEEGDARAASPKDQEYSDCAKSWPQS